MRMRREQALLVVVALLGLWIWASLERVDVGSRVRARTKAYEPGPDPRDRLVVAPVAADPAPFARDPFREPSETSPLPPTELPLPALRPLPVVALPLRPGQHPSAYRQLRVEGGVVEEHRFAAEAAAENGPGEASPDRAAEGSEGGDVVGDGDGAAGGPDELYDKVVMRSGNVLYGYVRNPDRYAMVGKPLLEQPIHLDVVRVKNGKIIGPATIEPDRVKEIVLAPTLRNRIELTKLRLGSGPGSVKDRRGFLEMLLREARQHEWVYHEAEQQADALIAILGDDEEGYRWKARVYREQGELGKEWQLYQQLPERLKKSSFYYRAVGSFEALLSLDADAEQHLQRAVEIAPNDPRSRLALARFLLDRGRAAEALPHAQGARRNVAALPTDAEVGEVFETLVAVHLALGRLDDAARALAAMPSGEGTEELRDFLAGALAYARGDWTGAREALARASRGEAALGVAACQVMEKAWDDARAALARVAADHPLLRHRALGALALLYERTKNPELALAEAEKAAAAHGRAPWVLYVLGRERRRTGRLDAAVEALHKALAERDDFVEVYAELAAAHLELAATRSQPGEIAELLYAARRYVDRTVELDARGEPDVRYLELQGVIRYRGRELRGAREAFAAGADRSLFCRIGLAVVDYARGREDEARARLTDLRESLRSDDPYRKHVEDLLERIRDHAQKEQLRDVFDRPELGSAWHVEGNRSVRPHLADGRLVIRGELRAPDTPVVARRLQPVAGKLLRVEVTIQVSPRHDARYALLQLALPARRSEEAPMFRVRFGTRDGKPYLRIEDGDRRSARRPEDERKWEPVDLGAVVYSPGQEVRLALELAPRPESGGRAFVLRAYWNDVLVHERPIERLGARTRGPLHVDLRVEGRPGSRADVSFDDFRLVRRKE